MDLAEFCCYITDIKMSIAEGKRILTKFKKLSNLWLLSADGEHPLQPGFDEIFAGLSEMCNRLISVARVFKEEKVMKFIYILLFVIFLIWFFSYVLPMLIVDLNRKRERAARIESERRARLDRTRREIDEKSTHVSQTESEIDKQICNFLSQSVFSSLSRIDTYPSASTEFTTRIASMQADISKMKELNNSLINEFHAENKNSVIGNAELKLKQAEKKVAAFKSFAQRVTSFPSSKMINEQSYGKTNTTCWDQVRRMSRPVAVGYASCCEQYFANSQVDKIYAIDIEKLLNCVWFFALEKPFSSSDFQKATSIFRQIYKQDHSDIILADLYVKRVLGGENSLREPVQNMIKNKTDSRTLSVIASGLMWMNAYQTEHMVLQYMLANGQQMTNKMQERLHALSTGGGKAPSGFDVQSSVRTLYFDVSSLTWKDDEYVGLFENLAFQDKNLTYSLAIRDENKELFIPQGITVPSNDMVLKKFSSVFAEEYGASVKVRVVNCIALSGSGEERMESILVSSGECKQMSILTYIARIGKKLTIKLYTLFMPNDSDLAMQKQQALSLYKNLSPSVTMWESSLKDTMLMAVEQILNSSTQGGNAPTLTHSGENGNEPVF